MAVINFSLSCFVLCECKIQIFNMNFSYVIHDTNMNDRTQNENKGKVTRQLTHITKLFPENKAVA